MCKFDNLALNLQRACENVRAVLRRGIGGKVAEEKDFLFCFDYIEEIVVSLQINQQDAFSPFTIRRDVSDVRIMLRN